MKINIQIEGATPEEAQRIFAPLALESVATKIIQDWQKNGLKRPVPDPTNDEETGCAGCPETGLTEACEKCSPPLPQKDMKTIPAEHHTAENPEKTRAHGPTRPGQKKREKPARLSGKRGGNNGKVNKYGIPAELYGTDKKKYQHLWYLCKRDGITYEEALKRSEELKNPAVKQSAQPIASSNEAKEPAKKERLPYKMKNKPAEVPPRGSTDISKDEPAHIVGGLDKDLADALPDEAPPTGHKEKVTAARTMENIKIGDQVRQIGGLKICAGIGTVKRAPPGNPEVLVGFGNGQEWIHRRNLAPVMA